MGHGGRAGAANKQDWEPVPWAVFPSNSVCGYHLYKHQNDLAQHPQDTNHGLSHLSNSNEASSDASSSVVGLCGTSSYSAILKRISFCSSDTADISALPLAQILRSSDKVDTQVINTQPSQGPVPAVWHHSPASSPVLRRGISWQEQPGPAQGAALNGSQQPLLSVEFALSGTLMKRVAS